MEVLFVIFLLILLSVWCLIGYNTVYKQIEFAERVESLLQHYHDLEKNISSMNQAARPLVKRMELMDKYEPFLQMLDYKRKHPRQFLFRFIIPGVLIGPLLLLVSPKEDSPSA